MRSLVAPDLKALKSRIALQALENMRSLVAPDLLVVLLFLTLLQALALRLLRDAPTLRICI